MADFFSANETAKDVKESKIMTAETAKKKAATTAAGWFVRNSNNIFTVLLLLSATVIVFVASVAFDNPFTRREITAAIVMLAACSYLLFLNGYRSGETEYLKTKDFIETERTQNALITEVKDKKLLYLLTDFCEDYIREELRAKRNEILLPENVSEEEFNKYIAGEETKLNESQLKACEVARKIKPIRLTREMILKCSETNSRSPLNSETKIKVMIGTRFLSKFISVCIASVFAFSLSYRIITQFSLATVLQGVVCVLFMLFGLVSGISFGFKIQGKYTAIKAEKNTLLKQFLEWSEKKQTIE